MSYLGNIARSFKYAIPEIVKNRIPNAVALFETVSKGNAQGSLSAAGNEIKSILKEDVFGIIRTGFANAQKEAKSGKLYQTAEEQNDTMKEAFGDFDMGDDIVLTDITEGDSSTEEGPSLDKNTAYSAAVGAKLGAESAADRINTSPVLASVAASTHASTRFARASLAANVAGNQIAQEGFMASATVLTSIHRFQTEVQQPYYNASIERLTAIAGISGEMVGKLDSISKGVRANMTVAEIMAASMSGKTETEFSRVFGDGFNLENYAGVLINRVKNAVSDGSQFASVARMIASAPLTRVMETVIESAVPKVLNKQLEQFNEFIANLGIVANDRLAAAASSMQSDPKFLKRQLGKFLSKLTVSPDTGSLNEPSLGGIVTKQAVAFDGYTHRSIVEIIPSYLADIHSELVAMRRGWGYDDPKDRKLYDFSSGKFTSARRYKEAAAEKIERQSSAYLQTTRSLIGDDGTSESAGKVENALRLLRDSSFSVEHGANSAVLENQLRGLIDLSRRGNDSRAADLEHALPRIIEAFKANGHRFSYRMTADLRRSAAEKSKLHEDVASQEGAARQIYSGNLTDPVSGKNVTLDIGGRSSPVDTMESAPSRGKVLSRQKKTSGKIETHENGFGYGQRTFAIGEPQKFTRASQESIFRNEEGKVSFDSILKSPLRLLSRVIDKTEETVSNRLFGDKGMGGRGLFSDFRAMIFGGSSFDENVDNRSVMTIFIEQLKEKVVNPLKIFMVGDEHNPKSIETSIAGRARKMFINTIESVRKTFIGDYDEHDSKYKGGAFSYLINGFGSLQKRAEKMLFGNSESGEQSPLVIKANKLVKSAKKTIGGLTRPIRDTIFGADYVDEKTGEHVYKKNILSRATTAITDKVVNPVLDNVLGREHADKNIVERVAKAASEKVIHPILDKIVGTGSRGQSAIQRVTESVRDKIITPLSRDVIGPIKTALMGDGKDGGKPGILRELRDTLKNDVFRPLTDTILGKKGENGKRDGGLIGDLRKSFSESILTPLKETFFGQKGVVKGLKTAFMDVVKPLGNALFGRKGIFTEIDSGLIRTFRDIGERFFGTGKNGPKVPFGTRVANFLQHQSERFSTFLREKTEGLTKKLSGLGDYLRDKVVAPFGKFMNDPETGLLSRMKNSVSGSMSRLGDYLYGAKKYFTDANGTVHAMGRDKGGLFPRISESIHKFFHGDKDTPGFVDRVLVPAKEFLNKEVWEPLKRNASEMWAQTKEFFANELVAPLKGVFKPITKEIGFQFQELKKWGAETGRAIYTSAADAINNVFKTTVGQSLSDIMRKNVLDPLKETLSSMRKFIGSVLGSVLKVPVNFLKGVSDSLREKHIRRGTGDYMDQSDRTRIISEKKLRVKDIGGDASSEDLRAARENSFFGRIRNRLAKPFERKETATSSSPVASAPAGKSAAQKSVDTATPPVKVKPEAGVMSARQVASQPAKTDVAKNASPATAPVIPAAVKQSSGSIGVAPASAPRAESVPTIEKAPSSSLAPGEVQPAQPTSLRSIVRGQMSQEEFNSVMARHSKTTADSTKGTLDFVRKHLNGVGHNLEKIVKHFKIRDTVGGNSAKEKGRGIFGTILNLITSPISAVSSLLNSVMTAAAKQFGNILGLIGDTTKAAAKTVSGLVSTAVDAVRVVGPVIKGTVEVSLKAARTVVGTAAEIATTVVSSAASAVGKATTAVLKTLPRVASSLGNLSLKLMEGGASILSAAGTLSKGLVDVTFRIAKSVMSAATSAVSTVTSGVTSVVSGLLGRKTRSDASASAKLTPVFVAGGYLAGITGGARTMAEAATGLHTLRIPKVANTAVADDKEPKGWMDRQREKFAAFSENVKDRWNSFRGKFKKDEQPSSSSTTPAPSEATSTPSWMSRQREKLTKLTDGAKARFVRGSEPAVEASVVEKPQHTSAGDEASKQGRLANYFAAKKESAAATVEKAKAKWENRMISASEATTKHLAGIRTGFARVGTMLLASVPALAGAIDLVSKFFTKGKFVGALADILKRAPAATAPGVPSDAISDASSQIPETAAKTSQQGTSTAAKPVSRVRSALGKVGSSVAKIGTSLSSVKGMVGLGAASAVANIAAEGMEDGGVAKRVTKSLGSAMQYGAMGAMFGPIGVAAGAGIGLLIENMDLVGDGLVATKDIIVKGGTALYSALGVVGSTMLSAAKFFGETLFGSAAEFDKTGNVTKKRTSNIIAKVYGAFFGSSEEVLENGQVVKDGGIGIVGNVNNMVKNLSFAFGKMLSGEDVELADFVRGTVFDGLWGRINSAFDYLGETLVSVGNGIMNGVRYITDFKFVDDIKSIFTGGSSSGVTPPALNKDGTPANPAVGDRSLMQRIGDSMKSWGSTNRSSVESITVDKSGNEIRDVATIKSRAFGGPLGSHGTLVGELGPEVLDRNGNVISGAGLGGRFDNPDLVDAATSRQDSVSSILSVIAHNTNAAAAFAQMAVFAAAASDVDAKNFVLAKAGSYQPSDTPFVSAGSVGAAVAESEVSSSSAIDTIMNMASSGTKAVKSIARSVANSRVGEAAASFASSALDKVKGLFGGGSAGAREGLLKALPDLGITDPKEKAMFMAQVDHESGGFSRTEENLSYSPRRLMEVFPKYFKTANEAESVSALGPKAIAEVVYGNRMGNTEPGDGYKYRGRGFLQLTGRDNYAAASKATGEDYVTNPDLAAKPEHAAKIAAWFWKSRGVDKPAREGDITKASQLINGGTNGLEHRKSLYSKYLTELSAAGATAAFTGGVLDGKRPTLVGEVRPEVISPDGVVHPSIESFVSGNSRGLQDLAISTAVKHSVDREASSGNSDAVKQILESSLSLSDDKLSQIINLLAGISENTSRALTELKPVQSDAESASNKETKPIKAERKGQNIFMMGNSPAPSPKVDGMSPYMRKLVSS